ncbi:hypothetical protein SAMN04488072_106124 [Lentibacillus halodurans]|uniref:Cytochrome C and Quinol oxidase polypeptide I n=1 Tax=Lentibacillus halodurans TaxID=237679 RepID=A0A1I0XZV8_9BACI|nr:hypothetical protein [Lentibacillus halodurans]SFB05946.1 hypothetical protein SAMN04488072_106124 [Lentibacillus halodurans]
MNQYSKMLLRFSAIFAVIGAFIGSHMAGAGSPAFKTVHAHILVVGWLTLFAWAVYYKIFTPVKTIIATLHVLTAIIGAIGLTTGMWLYYLRPFDLADGFVTVFFIVGGSIMLLSFVLFVVLTFMRTDEET